MACFPTTPFFDAPARWSPLEFLDETYSAKTTGMVLPFGDNFIILTSTVFDLLSKLNE